MFYNYLICSVLWCDVSVMLVMFLKRHEVDRSSAMVISLRGHSCCYRVLVLTLHAVVRPLPADSPFAGNANITMISHG